MSSRKFQNIWIFLSWLKFQNKKITQFLAHLMSHIFIKIKKTKNKLQSSTLYFNTTMNLLTFYKKSELSVEPINSNKSLNGRITNILSSNDIFNIFILSQKLFLSQKFFLYLKKTPFVMIWSQILITWSISSLVNHYPNLSLNKLSLLKTFSEVSRKLS